jgi:hypothetical protein
MKHGQGMEISMDTANLLEHKLLELFIMKDFMAYNKYLPINPRRQALENYQNDSLIQQRVNGVVGDVLEVVETYVNVHSEKN